MEENTKLSIIVFQTSFMKSNLQRMPNITKLTELPKIRGSINFGEIFVETKVLSRNDMQKYAQLDLKTASISISYFDCHREYKIVELEILYYGKRMKNERHVMNKHQLLSSFKGT